MCDVAPEQPQAHLQEIAFDYAFLLTQLGVVPSP
jgi:hypothetical protein